MAIKIYPQGSPHYITVGDYEDIADLIDLNGKKIFLDGIKLGTYDTFDRAAEIVDQLVNSFHAGEVQFVLPNN